jgi:hypothetical protein
MGQLAFDLEYDKEVMIDHSSMNQSKAEGSQSYSTASAVVTTFAKRLKQIRAYTIVPLVTNKQKVSSLSLRMKTVLICIIRLG